MNTKKMLLAILAIGSYAQSHAMFKYANHSRSFKQIQQAKRFCSTQTIAKQKSGFFWKFFTGILTGAIGTHVAYEKEVGKEIQKYGTLECPYVLARKELGKISPQDQQAP